MTKPALAPAFRQVAWVVRDIAAAERFFVETTGIGRFLHVDHDPAAAHLESSGYHEIQSFRVPIVRVGHYDTRRAIGVVTEIVGANQEGHELGRHLKAGNF